jgi:uncharacterized protein
MEQYVVDLKDLGQDKIELRDSFKPGFIDFDADSVRQAGPIEWTASVERAGLEIRIAGTLKTVMEQACSRCLETARYDVAKPFDLYFRQRDEFMFDEDDEIELTDKDTRTAFFTGTQLAIGDILREQVLLGLPMKPLCRPDCKGLCPQCGTNLNLNSCDCTSESFSPQKEALLQLKKRMEERSS